MEQVKFYADSKFNSSQMTTIEYSFEDGISMDIIKLYANQK